jgi:pyruvate/2-oxoglutarate dehydrogenase complex dihydrolipoamide acyltransferase (E2) component
MELPSHLAPENPWRSTALVASGVAALELFILVILAFAIFVKPMLSNEPGKAAAPAKKAAATKTAAAAPAKSSATKTAATSKPAKAAAPLARTRTKVLILNGNGRSGAASEKAAWVMTKGYPIAATTNASRSDFARSLVMYKPGFEAEAKRFGKDFNVSRVIPLDGMKQSELQGGVIVLIIGADS